MKRSRPYLLENLAVGGDRFNLGAFGLLLALVYLIYAWLSSTQGMMSGFGSFLFGGDTVQGIVTTVEELPETIEERTPDIFGIIQQDD